MSEYARSFQIIVVGRHFERQVGPCSGCAFSSKSNNTLTRPQRDFGCTMDACRRDGTCLTTHGNYKEVGVDYGK